MWRPGQAGRESTSQQPSAVTVGQSVYSGQAAYHKAGCGCRCRHHVNSTCAIHTPHKSWRSFISGGCRMSMEHSATTGSGCAFSSCLSTGTEDCAVPVVLSDWLTICFVLSTSDELSPAWLLTLTDLTVRWSCSRNATICHLNNIHFYYFYY